MTNKIFIPQPIAIEGEKFLISKGYSIFRGSGNTDKESLKKDIEDADAFILRTIKVDKEILEAGLRLKVVARHGAGYDNLDSVACKNLGIVPTYSPFSTGLSVAEFTITSILSLAKNIKTFERELKNDNFDYKFFNKGIDVSGKTLGIIGFGNIGKLVAKKAYYGLDMKIIAYIKPNTRVDIPEYVEVVAWDELFNRSDFVTIHVPGGKENENIIGIEEFTKMKKSAFLINASRGKIMNEDDFVFAIKNKEISGASIDVFAEEPPDVSSEMFSLENVILTPHIGSNTNECMVRIAMDCATDVHRVLSGEDPLYPIMK